MNPYYSAPDTPVDFTVARSITLREQWDAIEAAFDKLDGRTSFLVAGGTADALTVTMGFPPEDYEEGLVLHVKVTETNTGPATLNVNGLGAEEIVTRVNDPLIAGDLIEGSVETLFYVDGHFMIREVAGAQGPQGPIGPSDGPPGPQGDVGPAGPAGADGRTVLNGVDDPDAGDGVNGDFYINRVSWQIFGPKALGAWPAGVDLIGADGADGADSTVPGPQGDVGPQGPAGADGAGSTWADLGGKPAELVSLAALDGVADKLPYFSGVDTFSMTDLSAYMRALLATANEAALIADLGMIALSEFSPSSPGYIRFNCAGVIFSIMWGVQNAPPGTTTITYPDGGFSSFGIPVVSQAGDLSSGAQDNSADVTSASLASFSVYNANNVSKPCFWIAVGV